MTQTSLIESFGPASHEDQDRAQAAFDEIGREITRRPGNYFFLVDGNTTEAELPPTDEMFAFMGVWARTIHLDESGEGPQPVRELAPDEWASVLESKHAVRRREAENPTSPEINEFQIAASVYEVHNQLMPEDNSPLSTVAAYAIRRARHPVRHYKPSSSTPEPIDRLLGGIFVALTGEGAVTRPFLSRELMLDVAAAISDIDLKRNYLVKNNYLSQLHLTALRVRDPQSAERLEQHQTDIMEVSRIIPSKYKRENRQSFIKNVAGKAVAIGLAGRLELV